VASFRLVEVSESRMDVPHVTLASEAMYLPAQPDRAIPLRRCGSSPNLVLGSTLDNNLVSAPMNIENRRADLLYSNRVFDISPEIRLVSRSFRFQGNNL
jgi:hypothetical protein